MSPLFIQPVVKSFEFSAEVSVKTESVCGIRESPIGGVSGEQDTKLHKRTVMLNAV